MAKRIRFSLMITIVLAVLVPNILNLLATGEFKPASFLILGASLAVAALGGWYTIRLIAVPLDRLSEAAKKISEGDLTKRVEYLDRKDEIGVLANHFQRMVDYLHDMITSVSVTTDQVSVSAEELSAGAEQTTKAIEHVTVAIQEMATGSDLQLQRVGTGADGIEEMSRQVVAMNDYIRSVKETMEQTTGVAEDGNTSVISVVAKIEYIQQTVAELGDVIGRLSEHTGNIGGFIEVITGFAQQTNLLALNASIEAARAGEEGRGFAVVASEVRKLAEGSEQSAQQIAGLIAGIQNEVERAIASMENARQGVEEGIIAVDTSGRSFSRIRKAVRGAAGKMESVSETANGLAAGAGKITESIMEIRKISEENAGNTQTISAAAEQQLASVEEIASSSADLSRMAEQLKELVEKFKIHEL